MNPKPYPSYRESDVDWLGSIPEHWQVEMIRRRVGTRTAKALGEVRKVALENIEPWTGQFIELENVDYSGEGVSFFRGDVLFGKLRPYLAKAWKAEFDGAAVGDFYVYTFSNRINASFFLYLLVSQEFISIVNGSTYGSKMPRASWEFIGNLPLAFPPMNEQRQISDYLDAQTAKIDLLIEKQERLIETLAERRQAVISHAVTKGLDPNVPLKDSGVEWLGMIPQQWSTGQVKNFGVVALGKMIQPTSKFDSDFKAPYMRAANVQPEGKLALDDVKQMWFSSSELMKLEIRRGDIVVVEGGMGGFGRSAFVSADLTGWGFQNSINRIRPCEGADGRYLTYLLLTARSMGFIRAIASAVSMPHMTAEKLNRLQIPIPPETQQTAIADYLDQETAKIDALSAKARAMIDVLNERRQALISAAVTGKIDVRGLA